MEARHEIVYLDDNNNIVDKRIASKAIVRELDKYGNLVNETFMISSQKKPHNEEPMELTQEEIDYIKKWGFDVDIEEVQKRLRQ